MKINRRPFIIITMKYNFLSLKIASALTLVCSALNTYSSTCANNATIDESDLFQLKRPNIEVQWDIVNIQDLANPKALELKRLSEKGITLTGKSLNDLSEDFQTSLLQIDLFEGNNFTLATKLALDYIGQEQDDIVKKISKNPQLRSCFEQIRTNFDALSHMPEEDMSSQNYGRLFLETLKALQQMYFLLEYSMNTTENKYFAHFVYDVIKAQQVIIARHCADQIMTALRAGVESDIQKTSQSTEVSASVSVPTVAGNVELGVSEEVSKKTSDSSFYTINIGGEARVRLGADLQIADVKVGGDANVMRSLVFYSLEQLLDAGAFDITLTQKSLNDILEQRELMQSRETELLKRFGELEGFYKAFQVVPQSSSINWVDISIAAPVDSVVTYGVSAALEAEIAKFLGLSLKHTIEGKVYQKSNGCMSLLSDNCACAAGITPQDIREIIGEKYDLSARIKTAQVLFGDLYAYNAILEQLANDHATTATGELKEKKKIYEKKLLPESGFWGIKKRGRGNVLRVGIVTANALKEQSQNPNEQIIFKKIYEQLIRLSKLQKFSTGKKGADFNFQTTTTATNSETKGTVSFDIPVIGKVILALSKSNMNGSPFQDENGESAAVEFSFPVDNLSKDTMTLLLGKIQDLSCRMGEKFADNALFCELKYVLDATTGLIQKANALDDLVADETMPALLSMVSTENLYRLAINFCKVGKNDQETNVIALPKQDVIIRTENVWIPQDAKIVSTAAKSAKWLDVGVSSTLGKTIRVLSDDTLSVFVSKFNALRLGTEDGGPNTAWESFKTGQKTPLINLLNNINCEGKNSRYELQCLYNDLMKELPEKKAKKCTKLFAEFLEANAVLSATDGQRTLAEVVGLFDKLLQFNYKNNFLVHYNAAYREVGA
ncbi:MAG: hypothetical protein LBF84_03950 [Holosporales bacterium]|jgi:hypothetical protein|nr:hypothetical protein [Holosporales bacterium]